MSAFGTKRTSLVAAHMSAIGGKAHIAKIGIWEGKFVAPWHWRRAETVNVKFR